MGQIGALDQLPQHKTTTLESGSWEAGSMLRLGTSRQSKRHDGDERMYLKEEAGPGEKKRQIGQEINTEEDA